MQCRPFGCQAALPSAQELLQFRCCETGKVVAAYPRQYGGHHSLQLLHICMDIGTMPQNLGA